MATVRVAWALWAAPVGREAPGTPAAREHQEAELRRAAAGDPGGTSPGRRLSTAWRPAQLAREEAEGARDDVVVAAEEPLWTQPPAPVPPIPRGPRPAARWCSETSDLPEPVRGQSRGGAPLAHAVSRPAITAPTGLRRHRGEPSPASGWVADRGWGLCADVSPGLAGRAVDQGGEPGRGSTEP